MKIRTGTDIVDVKRILKILEDGRENFLNKCFTASEREYADLASSVERRAEIYAARFAAKEAAAKALGTGVCAGGIAFTDLEVKKDEAGAPFMVFHGRALELTKKMGMISVSISLSHEKEYAVAVCSILTDEKDS